MYSIIVCRVCGRNRIIASETETTMCPYCSGKTKTKEAIVLFKHQDCDVIRTALSELSGFKVTEEKKNVTDIDPMSSLEYAYGKAKGLDKLVCLAEGLTRIKGTFTLNDVEMFEPGKSEIIVKRMIAAFIVIEVRPGSYRYQE